MTTKKQVRRFMRMELEDRDHPDLWFDGEINYTRLVENAAWHFDHDEWLDDETHWVWDLAVEIADSMPRVELESRSGTGLSNCRSPFGYGSF